MPETVFDLIVVGSGMAGLSAARRASSRGVSTALFEQSMYGGLIINVNELDGSIAGAGAGIASQAMSDALEAGACSIEERVVDMEASEDGFTVRSEAGGTCHARTLVIASGASLKQLGIPGETALESRGVSHCADCDGPLFADRDVVVVGGGDSALQSALVLASFCRTVYLVHRRDTLRGKSSLANAVLSSGRIRVLWNSCVESLIGEAQLSAAVIRDLASGTSHELECAGIFPFIGLEPNAGFVLNRARRGSNGALETDSGLCTSVPGLFAAGAVRSGNGGTLEDAIVDGQRAADSAILHLRRTWRKHTTA